MKEVRHLTILGGGPAGLAAGFYAKKKALPFAIYEANDRIGGNCITLRHGEFLFDSGAHRLHDKYPDVTQEIQNLLGDDLKRIEAPSQIYHQGKFIDFPLSPLNLLSKIGFWNCAKSGVELFYSRLLRTNGVGSFEDFALRTYGRSLAGRFLLGYSEKLWGLPCKNLSPGISGSRMKGLGLKTFLIEAIQGRKAKTEHLDGSFYYPRTGYGAIAQALGDFCGSTTIHKNSRITRIFHDSNSFHSIEINGQDRIEINFLLNTLPLNLFLLLMDPPAPEYIRTVAKNLHFRNLILTAFFIKRPSISQNASIYFPDSDLAFTRIYEPRNRSALMAPPGHTSLIAEIPCAVNDDLWTSKDKDIVGLVSKQMNPIFQLRDSEITDTEVVRIQHAYPILQLGFEEQVAGLLHYLDSFENIQVSGRSGHFAYTHLHDMMKSGQQLIEHLLPTSS